jgi:hypothetical protein
MSDSLVFLHNRANELHVIDPDSVPHSDGIHPITLIAAAVINAGFEGVAVDQVRLSDGRYFQAIDVNLATPEGVILHRLQQIAKSGGQLPTPELVVDAIRQQYARTGTVIPTRTEGEVDSAGQGGSE